MELDKSEALDATGRLLMRAFSQGLSSYELAVRGETTAEGSQWLVDMAVGREDDFARAGESAIESFLVSFLSDLEWVEHVNLVVGGVAVDEVSDGLAGELFGDSGWIARFKGAS